MMTLRPQAGMGLVELMVGSAISLLIIGIIGSVYVNSKQVTRVNENVSRLQENGRFVLHLFSRDARMAGFRGCGGTTINPLNLINSAAYAYRFDNGIVGYHGSGSGFAPSLDASIGALTPPPLATSDVVTVRYVDGPGVPLTATMANNTADLQVSAASPLAQGDLLLVADCAASAIFQATAYNSGNGTVSHATGSGAPGNTAADLGHVFSSDASLFRLITKTYYVAPSARKAGTNSLWSWSVPNYNGQPQPEEMVEGVERQLLLFGEDTDGDRAANRYVTADTVGNWDNVVSIKPQLLLATVRDNTTTSPQPYTFAGIATTPTDRRLRSVLSSVITLRNRVP